MTQKLMAVIQTDGRNMICPMSSVNKELENGR